MIKISVHLYLFQLQKKKKKFNFEKKKKKFNVETKKNLLKFNFNSKKVKKKYFSLNGAIFLAKKKFYLNFSKPFIWQKKNKCTYIKIPTSRSIDIDTMEDLLEFKKIIRKK